MAGRAASSMPSNTAVIPVRSVDTRCNHQAHLIEQPGRKKCPIDVTATDNGQPLDPECLPKHLHALPANRYAPLRPQSTKFPLRPAYRGTPPHTFRKLSPTGAVRRIRLRANTGSRAYRRRRDIPRPVVPPVPGLPRLSVPGCFCDKRFRSRIMQLHRHPPHQQRGTPEFGQRLVILIARFNLLGHGAVDAPVHGCHHMANDVRSHAFPDFLSFRFRTAGALLSDRRLHPSIHLHQFILLASQPYPLAVLQRMHAVDASRSARSDAPSRGLPRHGPGRRRHWSSAIGVERGENARDPPSAAPRAPPLQSQSTERLFATLM